MESRPLLYTELEDGVLKSEFESLFRIIGKINDEECIRLKVTANPTLSRVTYKGKSILFAILERRRRMEEERLSIIKFMIQMNPSALLWVGPGQVYPVVGFTFGGKSPIFMIVHNDLHCTLMPWIAAKYPWLLDHEEAKRSVFDLIDLYNSRNDTSQCTTSLIKQFFEAYPQALHQEDSDGNSPLHSLVGSQYCDVDLFKWMAQRYPNNRLAMDESGCLIQGALLKVNRDGMTLLHVACKCLARYNEDNMCTICKYLIDSCPKSVQSLTEKGRLPIHLLLESPPSINHPLVREVIVCLLREYPESYDRLAIRSRVQGRVPYLPPFIRHIKLLLDKEKELMESANQLRVMPGTLSTAVACTSNELATSTTDVFNSWATSFVQVLDSKVKDISIQLDHACIHFDNYTFRF